MRLARLPATSAPCATASSVKCVDRPGEEPQTAEAIGMGGHQAQLDARHLPEKPRPDEHAGSTSAQQELEHRQADVAVPDSGAA